MKFNWKKDGHLARFGKPHNFQFADNLFLPSKVDLRPSIAPPVVDQGDIGSCTANAWAYLLGALAIKGVKAKISDPEEMNGKFEPLSRLFIYWNERALQDTDNQDSGATLTNGMQAVQVWGVCPESMWAYADSNEFLCPPHAVFLAALKHKIPHGLQVDNSQLEQIKGALAYEVPVVFGMSVYKSFMDTGSDGMVSVPDPSSEQLMGGHALCIMGYDDLMGCFIIENSWGPSWGDNGYCYIPYSLLTNTDIASDFWSVKT